MQDIRLRTGAAIVLCIAAFISLPGAIAVFVWWLLFTHRFSGPGQVRMLVPVACLIAFFSAVLAWTGGDGLSYFLRMMAMVFVGFWMFAEQKSGEFLRFGVWLLGDRAGFELGMLADMGMQAMHLLVRDFDRIRIAERLKGCRPGWKTLVPAGLVLVNGALSRAEQTAELMAVRGYRDGGSLCPSFAGSSRDLPACLGALCVLLIALMPVSEFFIL
jgi:energy-coupling factor transporter transmembrane protein EcfT